ncbi:MAG: hypothetical protein FWD75_05935 [Propionibacteriaceae bacterium]|nr:hypothetical protein [Propionibacteriaceae bacterium]
MGAAPVRHLLIGLAAVMTVVAAAGPPPSVVPAADRTVRALPLAGVHARPGACAATDSGAVTVVVDFQGLGEGTRTTCVSGLSAGSTSLDALRASGASVQGTARDGIGFVCRIDSRPGESEVITLPNGGTYVESCVSTPPATAYWSFWWAPQGGSWTYATQGPSTRAVVVGQWEGWSFSLGRGFGQAPVPRVTPSMWATPPPEPAPATSQAPEPPPVPPAPSRPEGPSSGGATSEPGSSAVAPTGDPAETDTPSGSESAGMPPSSSPSSSPQAGAQATPGPTDDADVSPRDYRWGAGAGVALTVLIGGAAAGVAWFRRRHGVP